MIRKLLIALQWEQLLVSKLNLQLTLCDVKLDQHSNKGKTNKEETENKSFF